MRKTLLVVVILIVLAVGSLVFIIAQKAPQSTIQQPVQATPTPSNASPVAIGYSGSMELNFNIGKNSFTSGENITAIISLKNTGDKDVSIAYLPNMPFNIFLYDLNGTLLETFGSEGAQSAIRADILNLKAGESFSKTLNFSVMPRGAYQVAGAFMGSEASQTNDTQRIEGRVLVKTEKITITIT